MALIQSIKSLEEYNPHVVLTGVSFRTLDVAGRERIAQRALEPERLARAIIEQGLASEAAVISTCNRFEIVSVGAESGGGIRAFFESLLELDSGEANALYQHTDAAAVRHVYRVSSSLDSMVVGEAQILGQVKSAYKRAVEIGSVGAHLHHLFQSAFHVAKRVRTRTEISQHGVSVSYVAVRLAEKIFGDLEDTSVLIIGSGEMAELAALHLCTHGCQKMIVANRTVERAAELAERFGGSAVSLSDIGQVLKDVDIVIGSIRMDRPILTSHSLNQRRGEKPLFMIDLGLPRNFAPDLADLDSVYLYNLDDLVHIADENRSLREAAARDAEVLIDYGLLQFERWRAKIAANPEVVDLRAKIEAICAGEVSRILSESETPESLELSKQLAHTISGKIAHELTALLERARGVPGCDDEVAPFLIVSDKKKE